MVKDGVQKDPILIDRETATVLDGMHRLAAFHSLKIENAVCCSVEYASRSVELGRWARVYALRGETTSIDFREPAGITRRVTLAAAFQALENRESALAALTSEAAYLPEGSMELSLAFSTVGAFDRLAAASGCERRFVPEEDVDVPLQGDRNLVVLVRRLVKEDVVNAARTGKLFPCKTSMHKIDPRPVAVNFPIDRLNEATSRTLQQSLADRHEVLLPPDSTYEGRRYKERLLLLNQR